MVLDFKVNARLVVGMTINFFIVQIEGVGAKVFNARKTLFTVNINNEGILI